MTSRDQWIYMPHAGHFICGSECRFRLNTYVNGWIISTVGEYLPDSEVRRILASSRGINIQGKGDYARADYLNKIGYEEIGCERLYETMVFRAVANQPQGFACCPYVQESGSSVDFAGYNLPGEAAAGHEKMCLKWADRDVKTWFEKHPDGDEEEVFDGAK